MKLEDYNKLSASRLRYYAKRLGIAKCIRMTKQTIISALVNFESTNKSEIGNVSISLKRVKQIRADYGRPMAKKVRKKRRLMSLGNVLVSSLIYVTINRRGVPHQGTRVW